MAVRDDDPTPPALRACGDPRPGIAPRKAIAALEEAPEKLELLLRWCPEKDASRQLPGEPHSIRSLVALLGTLDRHHYLDCVRRLAVDEERPTFAGLASPGAFKDVDIGECELPELLTRFRHFRAQSIEFLEEIPPEAWERVGLDAGLGEVSLAGVVALWVRHDAEAFARLNALSGELNKS
jgi:hypothetical protein